MRRWVSVWLPEFAIERLRSARSAPLGRSGPLPGLPRKARRPFALAGPDARGVVVTATNASARKAGVQTGQTLADARAICPGLATLPAEPEADGEVLRALALWLGRFGPNRNTDGADGLWVEITGVGHLYGGEDALLADLLRRFGIAGFTAKAAVADTYGAAYALARYGCARGSAHTIAEPGKTREALAPLTVEALRLAPAAVQLLKRLGLRTVGQILEIPRSSLARRFRDDLRAMRQRVVADAANAVVWRLDQALGYEQEPRRPLEEPPVRIRSLPFAEPLISSEGIEQAVQRLSQELTADLSSACEGAFVIRLSLYRSDGTRADAEIGSGRPCRDPDHIMRLLRERLDKIDAGLGIDLVTLAAVRVGPVAPDQCGLGAVSADDNAVARLIDRLVNRLGGNRVRVMEVGDSHLPERAMVLRPAQSAYGSKAPAGHEVSSPQSARPAFLLDVPEPIDVIAELPEGPPAQFQWRRVRHRITRANGPERIAPEWWRDLEGRFELEAGKPNATETAELPCGAPLPGEPEVRTKLPRERDYYVLEDVCGGRYWVFREGLYQREAEEGPPGWFMHGVFG